MPLDLSHCLPEFIFEKKMGWSKEYLPTLVHSYNVGSDDMIDECVVHVLWVDFGFAEEAPAYLKPGNTSYLAIEWSRSGLKSSVILAQNSGVFLAPQNESTERVNLSRLPSGYNRKEFTGPKWYDRENATWPVISGKPVPFFGQFDSVSFEKSEAERFYIFREVLHDGSIFWRAISQVLSHQTSAQHYRLENKMMGSAKKVGI